MRLLVLAAVLAVAALVLGNSAVAQGDKEADTIKKIMQKSFGGKNNFKTRLEKAVADKEWEAASKEAKAWLTHAKKLPDLKPPVGDADEFKKAAEKLVKTLTTANKAVEDKDADAFGKALRINCKSCHDNYRPAPKKKKGR